MPTTIPNEIRLMIVDNISSAHDLRSLRAVDRPFCNAATPAAFRTVGATSRRDSALGLVSLLESDLSQYVHEVIYRDAAADENGNAVDETPRDAGYLPEIEELLFRGFSLAARLPHLTTLRLVFQSEYPDTYFQSFPKRYKSLIDGKPCGPVHMQQVLLTTVGMAAPHLRALTLFNVTPVLNEVDFSDTILAAVPFLTHLHIGTCELPADPQSPNTAYTLYRRFWEHLVGNVTLKIATEVVSLTLVGGPQHCAVNFPWAHVLLPQLNCMAVKAPDLTRYWVLKVEGFTARHGQLEWIDMDIGADEVYWIRHTHADPEDVSEYETPPSGALEQAERGTL